MICGARAGGGVRLDAHHILPRLPRTQIAPPSSAHAGENAGGCLNEKEGMCPVKHERLRRPSPHLCSCA